MMIAEKIESVVSRISELEAVADPKIWSVLLPALAELADAADQAKALEDLRPVVRSDLTVKDYFTEPDGCGNFRVNHSRLGELLGDVAQSLREIEDIPALPLPSSALVMSPKTKMSPSKSVDYSLQERMRHEQD